MRVPFRPGRTPAQRVADTALAGRLLVLVVCVVIWDLVVRVGLVDPLFLAPPGDVVAAVGDLFGQRDVLTAFAETGQTILIAFLIGAGAGLAAACLLGASATVRRAYLAPLTFVLSTPKSIFLPVCTLIFGISNSSAAAFGVFEAFFYVVVNVLGGLDLVDPRHVRAARAFRAPRRHLYADVILPSALPGIFAALWYGIKHAFLGVMIAQLWASQGGIGSLIRNYSAQLKTAYVLAIVLVITVVAVVAGALWTRLEVRMNRWRTAGSAATASVSIAA
ncbi:ABC transporter permease [Streptomyces sp. NPDC050560]|uniref:ABC transporter permease n=1 Tax=Streptomyces sp. NPDC050560 TaxID=3365630 RepID=UPI003793EDAA